MYKKNYFVFLIFFICINFVLALNSSLDLATNCLDISNKTIEGMKNNNFSYTRLEDIYKTAIENCETLKASKEKEENKDYSFIISKCEEISNISNIAFSSKDSLVALKLFYEEFSEGLNMSSVDIMISEIENEMYRERYELIEELVEKTYNEIILLKSRNTILLVFYDATTRSLKKFISQNLKQIIITFFSVIFITLIFNRLLKKKRIEIKIKHLELRRITLKDLIKKNQDDYFNKGNISEESFNIRNQKLGELVRDIDRQIPLLKEQFEKLKKRKLNKSNKFKKRR